MDGREIFTTPKEMFVIERGSCSAVAASAAGTAAVPAALLPATSTAAVEKSVSVSRSSAWREGSIAANNLAAEMSSPRRSTLLYFCVPVSEETVAAAVAEGKEVASVRANLEISGLSYAAVPVVPGDDVHVG